ncbi:MAG: Gfo/Idh/MocA family oxidoreductase [Firmicutes bacterium]|nr:Gfo/Idh/MocA family oxidoreductase [Bacillota bacterium]
MAEIRMGVIGVGTMGKMHAEVYYRLPQTRLVALADINLERAKEVAAGMGGNIRCYDDYEKLLGDPEIDAVSIALPDHVHKEPVIAALQAGKHVLVEKPLATTLADCDRMLKIADVSGKILMVNYTHRWAPPYAKAKELLTEGKLGNPIMAYARKSDVIKVVTELWPWLADSTPPAFLSSHDIDLVRWFFESEAKSVYARGVRRVLQNKGINTLDAAQALVEFENGAIATFESGWIYPNTFPTYTDSYIELVTERGVIHLDRKQEIVEVADEDTFSFPKISISCRIDGRLEGAFKWCLEHFIQCIKENKEPYTSGRNARQVAEIVEAIHRSIESGQPVSLPLC